MQYVLNLTYALYGLNEAKQRCPLGAINRADHISQVPLGILQQQIEIYSKYYNVVKNNLTKRLETPPPQELLFGNCTDLSCFTYNKICAQYKNAKVEFVLLNDHMMLAIGRDPTSNPRNIQTWGEYTVICDPWAEETFLCSKFYHKQQGPNVPYYKKISSAAIVNREHLSVVPEHVHYLDGNPTIHKMHLTQTTLGKRKRSDSNGPSHLR
jgi:hypothetical protein